MSDPTDNNTENDVDQSDEFVKVFLANRHRIYAFIAKQLVHAADVEDVFQRTSVILWRKMDTFDPDASFFSWACGIAFNEVRNFLTVSRRSKLHFDADLVSLLAEQAKTEAELSDARLSALQTCMEKLPSRHQEVIRLCYMGTEKIAAVANQIGKEPGALYKHLARLKEKLLVCMRTRLSAEGE